MTRFPRELSFSLNKAVSELKNYHCDGMISWESWVQMHGVTRVFNVNIDGRTVCLHA